MQSITVIGALFIIFEFLFTWTYSLEKNVGGTETTIEKHPYQVSFLVIKKDKPVQIGCGGSLITTKFILSAAHCGYLECSLPNLYAGFGSSFYANGSAHKVDQWIDHPDYDSPTNLNDIAVVRLFRKIDAILGPKIAIVPLATNDDLEDGTLLTVSGWGREVLERTCGLEFEGVSSEILKEVHLPVYNIRECRKLSIKFDKIVNENQFCLGGIKETIKNACRDDSGVPVVKDGIQYGVVSYRMSEPCDNDYPQVYTKVSSYHDWIARQIMD